MSSTTGAPFTASVPGNDISNASVNPPPQEQTQQAATTRTFSYSSQCEMEIFCSPFGITGLYIKVHGSEAVGIGSTMARLTGFTTGKLYFNNFDDLSNAKYKLYGLIEDEETLRIDFIKIFLPKDYEEPKDKTASPNVPSVEGKKELPFEKPGDEGYEVPDIVFRGDVPAGRPNVVEPFIGVFNFERPPIMQQ